jgi:cytochrome oxidase Cu insertion factor (SCO1/SenC/PrrC family)
VDHSIIIYLMSPEGKFLKFFGQTTLMEEMVKEIHASVTGKEEQ